MTNHIRTVLELAEEILNGVSDGAFEKAEADAAISLALEAGLAALPDSINVDGVSVPLDLLIDLVAKPAIEAGIKALLEAIYPSKAVVNAGPGAEVTGNIR